MTGDNSALAGESYFRIMPWLLIILVIAGFTSAQIGVRPMQADIIPLTATHGLLMMAWFTMMIVQPRLIAARNYTRHKQFGKLSIGLMIAIAITGYALTRYSITQPDFSIAQNTPIGSAMYPFADMVTFLPAYCLAIYFRKDGAAHKRLMLVTSLLMMDAAIARLILANGLPGPLILLLPLTLYLSMIVYDWRSRSAVHWVSLVGLGLFAIQMTAKIGFASHESWASFARLIFG